MSAEPATAVARSADQLLLAALVLALLAIGGAWFSELALGYNPCKLCLIQRWPYYTGIPVGVLALVAARTGYTGIAWALTWLFVAIFLVSVGLGIYHSGVEWKFWAGPSDCGGKLINGPASVSDFRQSLATARVIRCDDAAVRVLGLSFAGWNAIVSQVVAGLGWVATRRV